MNYSPEAFSALEDAIEAQGGALLPETCVKHDLMYASKDGYTHKLGVKKNVTCGCNNESLFVVKYGASESDQPGSGFVTSCAVCDAIGEWPRFREAVMSVDPDLDILLEEDDADKEDDDAD